MPLQPLLAKIGSPVLEMRGAPVFRRRDSASRQNRMKWVYDYSGRVMVRAFESKAAVV